MPLYIVKTWRLLRSLLDPDIRDDPALTIKWVLDACDLLGANMIGIQGEDRPTVVTMGGALVSVGSFFNHSCESNVNYASDMGIFGSDVYFFAARDIAAGEELTIGYCESDAPREARQHALSGQYSFTCTCPKCVAEAPAEEKPTKA